MKEIIGYYNLKEDILKDTQYEVASWYEKVLVKSGKYEVVQYNKNYVHCFVEYHGVCVGSNFTSEFGGVAYGSKHDKEVGKHIDVSQQYYDYNIAELAYNGVITLVDGIKATKEVKYCDIFKEEVDFYYLVR